MGAGRGEECRDLLFDLAWLRLFRLAARDVHALVADTVMCAGDPEVERLGRMLRMSAHVLDRDKRQLAAQLLGRLRAEDGNRTALLLDAASREIPDGVLVPRGVRHLLPPGALPPPQALEGHSYHVYGAVVLADEAHHASLLVRGRYATVVGSDEWPEPGAPKGTVLVFVALCCWPTARLLSWAGGFRSTDHTLRLWDLTSGQSRVLEGTALGSLALCCWPTASASCPGLGFDSRLTTRCDYGVDERPGQVLDGHSTGVTGACSWPTASACCPGLRTSGPRPYALRLWDLKSGQSRVREGHLDVVTGALLLADGKHALSWAGASGPLTTLRL